MAPVFLNNPSLIELDDTYRGLSNFSIAQIKTATLERTILELENIGFVAILVKSADLVHQKFLISASKGKHGPCFYSDKSVEYKGKAFAALDDDNHIFVRGRPTKVCDKTSEIFKMEVYHNLMLNYDDSSGLRTYEADFELSLENVFIQLKANNPETERKDFFYPGPFRILILDDGTIIRRGKWSSIPSSMAKDLINYDGLMSLESSQELTPTFFQEVYEKKGSGCLMEDLKPTFVANQSHDTDFEALNSISNRLKERLINLIEKERKYFILIGNEANDKLGCCPSEEVSEANSLVRSGILEAISEDTPGDACPVTLYSFKNELSPTESGFSCKPNIALRKKVYKQLSKSFKPVYQQFVKWILLMFVAISLLMAVTKFSHFQQTPKQKTLIEALAISADLHVQVILFHNKKRCFQCERMERFTKETLKHTFPGEVEDGRIVFNTMIIDDPANMTIVEQFGMFASTIILLKYDRKKIKDKRILFDMTKLYQDEDAFKAALEQEIHAFLSNDDD